jgi:hypothetical protein
VFGATRDPSGRGKYLVQAVSTLGGTISSAEGVTFQTDRASAPASDPIDTLVVPGGFAVDG